MTIIETQHHYSVPIKVNAHMTIIETQHHYSVLLLSMAMAMAMAMAASFVSLLQLHTILSLAIQLNSAVGCCTSIFSFGDSLADTGNLLISAGGDDIVGRDPYGTTYFHRPTGRFSDGRLVVDFIAEAMGVPFLPPFLGGDASRGDFRQGVNFAVGGATALDNGFFREKGLEVTWTNYSLGVQMEWFKGLLPSLCSSDCDDILSKSLFLVGEIGGNDYGHAYQLVTALDEIRSFVPGVIDAISSVVNELIELGARRLVVPGILPLGCLSKTLADYRSTGEEDYEARTGCVRWWNDFTEYHDSRLREALGRIGERHPYATVAYADYYNAAMSIFRSPLPPGSEKLPLEACCGGGGPYNYNSSAPCGSPDARVCDDPSAYFCWDGVHLTEATYKFIADGLLHGPFAVPSIAHIISPLTNQRVSGIQEAR